jgi:hypothetical protein
MWPKMLFDLLPHFARLLPMADKYLSTRTASEKAQEAALAALAVDMRAELGKGSDAQSGLVRHMQEQSVQIGELALDVTRMRMGVEGMESRVGKLEKSIEVLETRTSHSAKLLAAVVTLAAASFGLLLVLTVYLLVRLRH